MVDRGSSLVALQQMSAQLLAVPCSRGTVNTEYCRMGGVISLYREMQLLRFLRCMSEFRVQLDTVLSDEVLTALSVNVYITA
jgi:hypothetical protein